LQKYGADDKAFSGSAGKGDTSRNTPTVFNAAGQFAEAWDGRVETVEDQVKQHEYANLYAATSPDGQRLVTAIRGVPSYAASFKKAFPDDAEAVTFDNVAKALGAFARKLVTPSKWDDFIKGNKSALSDDEKKGFLKFVEIGCTTCHVGPLVGGTMYQKLGKEKPWPNQSDKGRSRVTKAASDDMMFKVAQLRNIEHTAPYFHDASGKTLEEAVKTMASHQLNKDLPDDDVKSIVLWLKTLSGTIDPALAKPPEVPGANAESAGGQKKAVPPPPK
jgi:cytochrome c peroxidase